MRVAALRIGKEDLRLRDEVAGPGRGRARRARSPLGLSGDQSVRRSDECRDRPFDDPANEAIALAGKLGELIRVIRQQVDLTADPLLDTPDTPAQSVRIRLTQHEDIDIARGSNLCLAGKGAMNERRLNSGHVFQRASQLQFDNYGSFEQDPNRLVKGRLCGRSIEMRSTDRLANDQAGTESAVKLPMHRDLRRIQSLRQLCDGPRFSSAQYEQAE